MEPMQQSERQALICRLIQAMQNEGSWAGQTHIQKSVLFLQDLMGVPMGYQFVLYLHGPFSFDLRNELAKMRARLMLDIKPRSIYGPSFDLGHWGDQAAARSEKRYEEAIQFVAKKVSCNDTRTLEELSTAFFLKDKYPNLSDSDIAIWINKLKPHITTSRAYFAIGKVEELRTAAACVQITEHAAS